jgi:alcohol dehydrogenase class IV
MNNYYNTAFIKRFHTPNYLLWGNDTKELLFEIVPNVGDIILVIDRVFLDDSYIKKIINDYRVLIIICQSEPDTKFINKQILRMPKKLSTCIAIGGGSTIDTAKALIAQNLYNEYRQIGYGKNRYIADRNKIAPPLFVALPTTAGTGSEVSRYWLIKDHETGEKLVSRSWQIVPTYSLLDPYFLRTASLELLCLCAFDAFIHLWETFICRYEGSYFTEIMALEGITRIMCGIEQLQYQNFFPENILMDFQVAAAFGGIALSNTRTGIIHDAGEALSAQIKLSHPETLYVFLEKSIEQYYYEILKKDKRLITRLKSVGMNYKSIIDIVAFWKSTFQRLGIEVNIKNKLCNAMINIHEITQKIMQDTVLVTKESPLILTEKMVDKLVKGSLSHFMGSTSMI